MLTPSLALLFVAGAAIAAPPAEIAASVSETLNGADADAREMYRLGAFLRMAGDIGASDAWFDAALRLDPEVDARAASLAGSRGVFACGSIGPDLSVAAINAVQAITHVGPAQGGVSAFGFGVSVCNLGDSGVEWVSSTSRPSGLPRSRPSERLLRFTPEK